MIQLDEWSRTRKWAILALGAALAYEIVWIVMVVAAGRGSLAYLARPLVFTASLGVLFLTFGRVPAVVLLARLTIAGAFLSALWHRFDNFHAFIAYAARVNSFLPADVAPYLAVIATTLECLFCLTLLLGIYTRWAALGSAILLFLFATAMAASGLTPAEWAVYVLSAGAWVISTSDTRLASVDSLIVPPRERVRVTLTPE
jgi:uncharacterized membrane protein YphA (DoxX/SURF4 family)